MEEDYDIIDKEPLRESFLLYASWYKYICTLSPRKQSQAYKAICDYCFFNTPIPKACFSATEYAALSSFRPTIEKHKRNYENGLKGASSGSKGGRPKKSETPPGFSAETERDFNEKPPTDTVTDTATDTKTDKGTDAVTDRVMSHMASSPSFQDLVKELLPIFFFKNNCLPERELKKFYDHYSKNDWRLTGGDVLNTGEKRKQAAEKWKVQDPQGQIYPPQFVGVWREIYKMLPPELRIDAVQIGSTSRGQYSVSLICSAALKSWLDNENNHEVVMALFHTKISPNYRFEYYARKDGT